MIFVNYANQEFHLLFISDSAVIRRSLDIFAVGDVDVNLDFNQKFIEYFLIDIDNVWRIVRLADIIKPCVKYFISSCLDICGLINDSDIHAIMIHSKRNESLACQCGDFAADVDISSTINKIVVILEKILKRNLLIDNSDFSQSIRIFPISPNLLLGYNTTWFPPASALINGLITLKKGACQSPQIKTTP
eukprot:CAMPEP_0176467236 /NCGR_PEP_ID=MMETSP0127-20121128/38349_1 /TAXON_ID=938130 /ORGANISM="Platyophrya macrostoma, Strain WH" /LENGTH=189 /DNA_ID=CAMNT_0017860519 /DNA_START=102 /DNA_END=671 /DNA_ORIENTATION=+